MYQYRFQIAPQTNQLHLPFYFLSDNCLVAVEIDGPNQGKSIIVLGLRKFDSKFLPDDRLCRSATGCFKAVLDAHGNESVSK